MLKAVNRGGCRLMTMKRIGSVIVALCIMLGMIFSASAEVVEDTSTTTGIDVVVVLDMTSSMGKETQSPGNDPWGYRIDATAMLIGMMDMDGSRVAIVPFANVPGKPAEIKDFTDVSDSSSRITMIRDIYGYLNKALQANTNIGAALMKAEQMLLNREDQSNRPMIVLMTDGKNSITNQNGGPSKIRVAPSIRFDRNSGTIQEIQEGEEYDTELADRVTREAADCAKANNIPIYSVALGKDTDTDVAVRGVGISLIEISQLTGAMKCQPVVKDEAYKLPTFFAEILADKIGSSVEYTAKPQNVGKNLYEVKIPILNREVLEANIILPVKARQGNVSSIDPASIELYDSNGNRKMNDDREITILNNFTYNHFAMVKIRDPRNPGMWTLRFKSEKEPDDISFNILYKYNIKFEVSAEDTNGSGEFFKRDTLKVTARFVNSDGTVVEDPALYTELTGAEYEPWMTINSNWSLYHANSDGTVNGGAIKSEKLTPDPIQNQFGTNIDLSNVGEVLKHGNYVLVVTAAGAGLERTVRVPLELKNHAPAASNYTQTILVNSTDENKPETWTVEGTSGKLNKNVRDIVTDQDDQNINFSFLPVDDAQSYAIMKLEDDGSFSFRTIRDETYADGEKVKFGTAVYKLTYNDGDEGKGEIQISLNIRSEVDEMLDAYNLEVKVDGNPNPASGDDCYLKNTPLTITAELKDKTSGVNKTGDELLALKRQIQIADLTSGNAVVSDGTLELNDAKDALVYQVETTGNKEAAWKITVNVGNYDTWTRDIRIPNENAPVPAPLQDSVSINCDGEKVPGFLASLIGEDTPADDPSRTVTIQGMFSDADNDMLEYSEPVFYTNYDAREGTDENVIRAEKTGEGVYVIHVSGDSTGPFRYTLNSEMHLTATDGDGKSADYVRTITIVDLYNKMITYLLIILIAIAALVILYLIVHQIRKPVFPKLNMTIREEPSLYESGSETLSPVKTPTNLNALGVDGDMANKHGISMELLQNIIVKPIRSRTSVGVVCRKAAPGHEVMLEDVKMKPKKAYTWKIGQELTVHSENGDGMVAVKLEECPDENEVYEEFQSDEWAEVDENDTPRGGRKHSRKAERKAPPAEEQQESSGSSDDFDF